MDDTVKTRHQETRPLKSGCPVCYEKTKENLTGRTVSYKFLKVFKLLNPKNSLVEMTLKLKA